MGNPLLFQYCQKLVILSADKQSVLLARRQGEADYDGTYSFIGGKLETTDESLLAGMQREKNEEIGPDTKIQVAAEETYNLLFVKADGSHMILPHVAGIFETGTIQLNDEYSDFQWVQIERLASFEPKISNIPELTAWAIRKLSDPAVKLQSI